jgi:diguanylate cyclase (GGDEF)-like protein
MKDDQPPTLRGNVSYDPGPETLVLVGLDGPGAGCEFVLCAPASVLGRGPGASLVLPDPQASRRHCKFVVVPDPERPSRRLALLQDLHSTNGVRVNGRKVKRRLLHGGEKLLVGGSVLRFERRDSFDAVFYARLQQLATSDPLTGLGNRLAMNQELERQEAQRLRYGRSYSVLLLDVDEFKRINDERGHAVGDRVLREVASIVLAGLRDSDRAYRFGGDEFLVVLTETDREGAGVVAERIRQQVGADPLRCEGGPLALSVSIGAAEAAPDEDLIERVDKALYRAKRGGRNRVWLHPSPKR